MATRRDRHRVTEWRGWLTRHNGLPEVHGAQRLWNVAEAMGRRVNNIAILPGPESLSDQLLMETALVYFRHVALQGRSIAVIAAEVGPAEIAYANHRTQYEHYMDLRYLLLGDIQEQRRKALRVHLFASRDFLNYAGNGGRQPSVGRESPQISRTARAGGRRTCCRGGSGMEGREETFALVRQRPKGCNPHS